jgi:MFS family permease
LLLDRVIGLLGLFLLFLFSGLKFGLENKEFLEQNWGWFIIGLIFISFFVFLMFLPNRWQQLFQKPFSRFLKKEKIAQLSQYLSIFREHKKKNAGLLVPISFYSFGYLYFNISNFYFPICRAFEFLDASISYSFGASGNRHTHFPCGHRSGAYCI